MLAVIGANRPHLDAIAVYLERKGLQVAKGNWRRPFPDHPLRVLEVRRSAPSEATGSDPLKMDTISQDQWEAAIAVTEYGDPLPELIDDADLPQTVFCTPFRLATLLGRVEEMLKE